MCMNSVTVPGLSCAALTPSRLVPRNEKRREAPELPVPTSSTTVQRVTHRTRATYRVPFLRTAGLRNLDVGRGGPVIFARAGDLTTVSLTSHGGRSAFAK